MASTDPALSDASCAALIPLGSHASNPPIDLKRPIFIIGARKDIVRLHLQSSTISKAHCVIVVNNWGCYVHDLGSRTGTLVNGKPIQDHDLNDGDVLQVGRFQFKYRAPKNAKPKPKPLPAADLTVSSLTEPLRVHRRVIAIGRRQGSDVQFDDSRVSNLHALIVEQDGRRLVRDLTSRTGTWLDEKPIHQEPLADGAPLRIGGATLSIADHAEPQARAPGDPLTLAEVSAGPGVAAALELADLDLSKIGAPDDTIPAAEDEADDDALADLRRGWQAPLPIEEPLPVEPVQPAEPAAEPPGAKEVTPEPLSEPAPEPVAEVPIEPVQPVTEAPAEPALELEPLDELELEPLDAPEVEAPAAEVQADASVTEAPKPAIPESAPPAEMPVVEAPKSIDDEIGDLGELEPVAESDEPIDIEALALEALELDADAPAADAKPADVDDLVLDEAAPATPVGETPATPKVQEIEKLTAKAPEAEESTAGVITDVETAETAGEPDVAPESDATPVGEALADTGAGDSVDLEPLDVEALELEPLDLADLTLKPDADAPSATSAEIADVDALRIDEDAPRAGDIAPLPVDELELATESAAEVSADEEVTATELPPAAVVEPPVAEIVEEAADEKPAEPLAELSLDDLSLLKDPDAPLAEAEADVDDLLPDPDAPAVVDEAEAAEKQPEIAVISSETAIEPEATDASDIVSDSTAVAETVASGDLVDLAADELDEADAEIVADASQYASPAPAVEEPVAKAPANLSETLPLEDDVEDLLSDLDAPVLDIEEPALPAAEAPLAGAASLPTSSADDLTKEVADESAEVVAEEAVTPTTPVPSAIVEPELPPVGHDLVSLDEETEEDENEATALAVDLGLVLDDDVSHDIPEFTAAAPPAEPVDIDLADARPVSPEAAETKSIDLSHLGAEDDHTFTAHAVSDVSDAGAATDEAASADLFDVDDIELIEPETPAGPRVAAEAPPTAEKPKDEDDHIAPPEGGKLSDLIPGGPPLLGGSFMSFPPMMSPPPAPPEGKRRPLRVGFGQEPRPGRTPFAAERTIADAVGGPTSEEEIEGLIAGATSVDAFSGAAMPPARPPTAQPVADADFTIDDEDIDLVDTQRTEIPAPAAEALPAKTEVFRPRGTIRPVAQVGRLETDEARIAAVTPADVNLARAKRHKRRVARVIACLIGMVVLIGGAAWGVYYFLPLRSTVDALINFNGLDQLSPDGVARFRAKENELLVTEQVRQNAVLSLPNAISSGFLSDGSRTYEAIDRDPKVRWPADRPTVMRLHLRSDDMENDLARLRALGESLVSASANDRKEQERLDAIKNEDQSLVGALKAQYSSLNDQLQALRQAAAGRPELKNLSDLNAEFLAAEPALTAIKSKRQELEATVDRLSKPVAAQPASTPAVDSATADKELTDLGAQLAKLQQPVATPENTAEGAEARKKLDDSISALEKDLASAQKQQASPELSGYVEAANRAFTEYKGLIDIYIRSQENQRTRLSELKAKLSDRMQQRAQDLIAKDSELKKLKDNLDILTRQYNAATASGFDEEAKKSELELRLLKVKVAEREDQLNNDTVSSEAITGLQGVIDGIEKDLRDSRKQLDEKVTTMQAALLKSAPPVQNLPADQKQTAEGIQGKLAAVNEARRVYNDAAEKAQAEQAKADAANAEQAAALRLKIAARRQDLLAAAQAKQAENDEATRKRLLATAQNDLATVRQQEQAAAARVTAASAAIEANEKQRRVEAQANAEMQSKQAELNAVSRKMQDAQATLNSHQADRARLIVPDSKVEMNSFYDKDRRGLYAAGAGLLVVLLLGVPMLMDLLALAREAHHPIETAGTVLAAGASPEGFEPMIVEDPEHKALPEPASV